MKKELEKKKKPITGSINLYSSNADILFLLRVFYSRLEIQMLYFYSVYSILFRISGNADIWQDQKKCLGKNEAAGNTSHQQLAQGLGQFRP